MIEFPSVLDLSALVVIISAMLLYFGKLISDSKVEIYKTPDLMIKGLFFILWYLIVPSALVYFIFTKNLIVELNLVLIILLDLFIISIYSKIQQFKNLFYKYRVEKEYKKRFSKKIKTLNYLPSRFFEGKENLYFRVKKIYEGISSFFSKDVVLLVFSFYIAYSFVSVFNQDIFILVFVGVLSFVAISAMAISHGMKDTYYPPTIITLDDGKKISGDVLKFGDFVYILDKDKKYFVNKDKIKFMEQDILKKKK